MEQSYIVGARRTAIGRFGESLRDVPARTLGAIVIEAALAHAGVSKDTVDEVVLGQVLQAGSNFVARNAAMDAGIPCACPAWTINQACASGLVAILQADRAIRVGERELMVAGGVESMSNTPYLSRSTRWGSRMGAATLEDELSNGLSCSLTGIAMGQTAENVARRHDISRRAQDEWALRSQIKAREAIEAGRFVEEIVPVMVPRRKGEPLRFDTDEHPRATTLEQLSALRPAFANDGTVTAGNASGINDGGAALLVASASAVERHGLKPLARIVAGATTGIEPEVMGLGPVLAIRQALAKARLQLEEIDLFEINEAFAAQLLGVLAEVPIAVEKLNVNGSGIALGHPIGATGARITVSLLHEMERRQARYGLASLCVGGGMGAAMIVERIS